MPTNNDVLPRHGVTGLAVSEKEINLFLNYLAKTDPEPAKVHIEGAEQKKKEIRDAETRFIDPKETDLYKILNKILRGYVLILSIFCLITTKILQYFVMIFT